MLGHIESIYTIPLDTFAHSDLCEYPCEMLIDYHTKKLGHLNTLKRFNGSFSIISCVSVITSTSMIMNVLGLRRVNR